MRGNYRIFLLLQLLSDSPPQSLTDLAQRAELPKPTVLRFLRSLETGGWVTRDSAARYSLGPEVLTLAQRYLSRTSMVTVAAAPMQALRDRLGETISLSAIAGDHRVCVQEFASFEPLRHVHEIGSEAPLYAGASGRVLLAYMPAAARARILSQEMPGLSPTTITDPDALESLSATIRETGYAISLGEKTAGSVAVAVPVRDVRPDTYFALAVFAPEVRFVADRDLRPWTQALLACAREIEQAAGLREATERAVA